MVYKLIHGNSLAELEARVNFFLEQPENVEFHIHGDIQMYAYTDYVQVLTKENTVNVH